MQQDQWYPHAGAPGSDFHGQALQQASHRHGVVYSPEPPEGADYGAHRSHSYGHPQYGVLQDAGELYYASGKLQNPRRNSGGAPGAFGVYGAVTKMGKDNEFSTTSPESTASPSSFSPPSESLGEQDVRGAEVTLHTGQRVQILDTAVNCERLLLGDLML